MRIPSKFFLIFLLFSPGLLQACNNHSQLVQQVSDRATLTDREADGLSGLARAVLTDDVVLIEQNGQWYEAQQASSVSIYDESGKRSLQTPYRINLPGGYAITQHELLFDPMFKAGKKNKPDEDKNGYIKYDGKGNVTERGSSHILPDISVQYEYDSAGNWIKRVISKPVVKGSQKVLMKSEASYRQIIYFNSDGNTIETRPAELLPVGAKQLSSVVVANESNISRGRSLFNQKCIACHGEDGKSQTEFAGVMAVRPKDLTSTEVRALTEGEIFTIVANGIPSKGMPGLKGRISDESLWQISLYVRQLSRNKAPQNQTMTAAASSSPSAVPKVVEKRYLLKGKVISIERDQQQVTIEHEVIPGYMGAMTMPFPLKDLKTLETLKKDDQIQATLVVNDNSWRLENVLINKQ